MMLAKMQELLETTMQPAFTLQFMEAQMMMREKKILTVVGLLQHFEFVRILLQNATGYLSESWKCQMIGETSMEMEILSGSFP